MIYCCNGKLWYIVAMGNYGILLQCETMVYCCNGKLWYIVIMGNYGIL